MPRKVTDKIVSAFLAGQTAKQANTSTDGNSLFLHGNEIAKMKNGQLWVTNAGWFSNTTKERLNGLPGVSVYQKAGKWYLNDVEWDGNWISVGKPSTMESRRVAEAKVRMILKKIIKEEIVRAVQKKNRISEAVKGINLEQPHSNLYIKGWGNDSNGNWSIIVGFPNDRGFAIQTSGNLPKTHDITKSSGKNLSDEDLDTIGREITDYTKEYGSKNVKSRLRIYGGQKSESRFNRTKRRISEAYGLHPDVIRQYLETALWSSNDESDESGGEPFDANYDISDIAPESVAKAKKDIEKFIDMAEEEGVLNPYLDAFTGPSWGNLGHDFWLTRNGHGAGFWDRNEIDDEVGKKLTEISKKFREVNPILGDDGKIYFE